LVGELKQPPTKKGWRFYCTQGGNRIIRNYTYRYL